MNNRSIILAAALAFGTISAVPATAQDVELEAKMEKFEENLVNPAVPPKWFTNLATENDYVESEAERRFGYSRYFSSDIQACRKEATGITLAFNANGIKKCVLSRVGVRHAAIGLGLVAGVIGLVIAGGCLAGPQKGGAG